MLETVLQLQNPHWSGQVYEKLFNRTRLDTLIQKLKLKEIQVLLGIRRSGKSTLFKLIINYFLQNNVKPKSILYLNLDDPFYAEVWHSAKSLYSVIETAEKLTGVKPAYLFLDEIQNVHAWERFVKSMYDTEIFKKIFVTGSNSSLLSGNYAKLLSGRYVVDQVMPLSFNEIIVQQGIADVFDLIKEKPKVLNLVEQLLFYGSFPEVWKTENSDLKREQLLSYYETIVLKDCIANHNVRETKKLQELGLYLLTNNATLYSYNGLAKTLNSNENTIKQFIHIFENSFLINELKQLSYSLKLQTRTQKKSYCIDNGLIHAVSFKFSENRGRLFENLVFSELCKAGCKEIYFYNETSECDFLVKIGKKLTAIQVSFELNENNYQREVNGLEQAMQKFSALQGIIVTFNSEEKKLEKNIMIIPFWKLFFGDVFSKILEGI